ncbi:MAG: hypothetical protein DBX44_00205 [Oscillospiraceae bacterium]|nr:MAG: hypothetical protein DBX44_00205 [Oscillospiraceae bacterium]
MSGAVYGCASPEDRSALMDLWKRVFGDPDDYLSLFFDLRFRPDQALVARNSLDGTPISMLFLLPIVFQSGSLQYRGRYIYAVATDPAFRSRGLSSQLLAEAHRRLSLEGLDFSVLVPAERSLFDYYAARGFRTEFFRCAQTVFAASSPDDVDLSPASLPALLPLRDALGAKSTLYGRWDQEALAYQQRETSLLGGETLSFFWEGKPGYAVCHPTENTVLIKEWGASAVSTPVLSAIAHRFGKNTVQLDLPASPGAGSARPFAMTRWYCKERKYEEGDPPVLSLVLD